MWIRPDQMCARLRLDRHARMTTTFFGGFFLFWVSLGLGAGCTVQSNDQGIVARVNGEPIFLVQLEAKHDLKYLPRSSTPSASLESLQDEYGTALSEMVINILVAQYLGERNMAVLEQDLAAAEFLVRADYPEDAFEQMLVEEYIDLNDWREQLRATLNMETLFLKVLRPQIAIDYQEVDAYYREHIVDFYLRPRITFLLIQGSDKDSVEKVLELSRTEDDPSQLGRRFDKVEVQDYTLYEDNIPREWRTMLEALEPDQATDLMVNEGQGHQAMVLLERTPGRLIDPAQAYPLVERILVERKLNDAFEIWLASAINAASIEVNTRLLQREPGEEVSANGSRRK